MIKLSNLTYYPIKSCRGFDLAEAHIERMGLANDRRMMLVTPEGKFLTQAEYPKLALVTPAMINDTVTLSAPNFDPLRFTIQKMGAISHVSIWESKNVQAIDQGDETAQWLSDWIGASVRLVRIANGFKRKVNSDFAVSAEDHIGFADDYPILLISEASLRDLNSKLNSPQGAVPALPMNRFRPNIVVQNCEPFAEDTWKRIKIGDVEMALINPAPRCVVTTIDKETLEKSKEPLKTLSTYRKQKGGVMFGMHIIPLNEGEIKTGMHVEILE